MQVIGISLNPLRRRSDSKGRPVAISVSWALSSVVYEPEVGEDDSSQSEDEELEGMCFLYSTFKVSHALFLDLLAYKPRRRATRGSVAARSWHPLSPLFFAGIFRKCARWSFEDTEGLLYTFLQISRSFERMYSPGNRRGG